MSDSLFKRFESEDTTVRVQLDGAWTEVPAGMSVAAALLAKGEIVSRLSPSSGRPCSPHCLMGVCFECLMEIDGIERQACVVEVAEGLVINRNLDRNGGGSR